MQVLALFLGAVMPLPSRERSHLLRRLVMLSGFLCYLALSDHCDADTLPSLHSIIRALNERMTTVGELSGKLADFESAIQEARLNISRLLMDGNSASLLSERDSSGRTPLMAAATAGYAEVVEEILLAPEARAAIDETDSNGLTAWDRTNFAWHQAAWACNPGVARNVMSYVPLLVIRPYYKGGESPYLRTRRVLETAGASIDMERAKRAWVAVCKHQLRETAERVKASDDLLLAVLEEGDRTLEILHPGINKNEE